MKRLERWSVLPAYSVEGVLVWYIYQGGILGACFDRFFQEEVLPQYTPFPGNNSVFVIDNVSIHHFKVSIIFFLIYNILILCFKVFLYIIC